jgi:hypothetical protein
LFRQIHENFSRTPKLDKNTPEALKEAETCKLIEKRFAEAKTYREKREDKWRECEDFYSGNHWKDAKKSYKNFVFSFVEQEAASLSDAIPGTDVLAYKEGQEERAKTLEGAIHFVLDRNKAFLKDVMAIKSALKTGTGWQYVDFDPDADNGKGMPIIKNIPWQYVYVDPAATEIDEASFVGIKFPIRIEEAKRRFPKFADDIGPSKEDNNIWQRFIGEKEDRASYSTSKTPGKEDKSKLDNMVTLEEAWLRSFEMVAIPEEETSAEIEKETEQFFKFSPQPDGSQVHDPEIPDIGRHEDHAAHIPAHEAQLRSIAGEALGIDPALVTEQNIEELKEDAVLGTIISLLQDHIETHKEYYKINPKGEKPKYNSGLRLVMKVNNTIVYDGDAPVNDGRVPLVPFYCYKDEDSIYAMGEVEQILSCQKSYNEMDDAEYVGLKLSTNPGWQISPGSGVKPSSITNRPGQVFTVNEGHTFKRLDPGQVSPQLGIRKQNDESAMRIITGQNEASQGRQPGGVTAARAIEALQAQTNGRYRLKSSQNAMYSIQRRGELIASRIVQYWTTDRYMRISDPDSGDLVHAVYRPEDVQDLEYEIRVTPGALAGVDKQAIYEVMDSFVQRGMITPKLFFQVTDLPHKKKIIEELEANDQLMQQAQMLQQENEQLKAVIAQAGIPIDQIQGGAPTGPSMPAQSAPQT